MKVKLSTPYGELCNYKKGTLENATLMLALNSAFGKHGNHPHATQKPWFFYSHVVKTPSGTRLHYTVQNRITGETLCTYRQIKKARQTVLELNAGGRRLM